MDSIVATLLALAVLAEQAAGDTPWVRWRVLWAARQADLIAREFVAGSTWNPAGRLWSPALPTVRYGTLPADALDLAASLRALAFVVMNMAAQRRLSLSGEARDESAHDGNAPHGLEAVIQRLGRAALRAVELRDTS
ncbi:MAG: hypothetical protein KF694_17730 [Mesorhizobium sp.]|nr:hypothetical protein [Mesorhizobium sp.]